jgi:hypothetical protein
MDISGDAATILVVMLVMLAVIGVFIYISVRVRKGGGSMTTMVLGATDEFLSRDNKAAAETIVEINAGNKAEERNAEGKKNDTNDPSGFAIPPD